jgi:uncharacterized protein YecT (DUF1311 family)
MTNLSLHKRAAIALVLAGSAPLASASDDNLSSRFSSCMDRSGGVTVEMLNCIGAETKQHDARLNRVYKQAMGQLSAARQQQLRDAQRAWLKYRDANCGFYADPDGGTLARVNANSCVMIETADRADELDRIVASQ